MYTYTESDAASASSSKNPSSMKHTVALLTGLKNDFLKKNIPYGSGVYAAMEKKGQDIQNNALRGSQWSKLSSHFNRSNVGIRINKQSQLASWFNDAPLGDMSSLANLSCLMQLGAKKTKNILTSSLINKEDDKGKEAAEIILQTLFPQHEKDISSDISSDTEPHTTNTAPYTMPRRPTANNPPVTHEGSTLRLEGLKWHTLKKFRDTNVRILDAEVSSFTLTKGKPTLQFFPNSGKSMLCLREEGQPEYGAYLVDIGQFKNTIDFLQTQSHCIWQNNEYDSPSCRALEGDKELTVSIDPSLASRPTILSPTPARMPPNIPSMCNTGTDRSR